MNGILPAPKFDRQTYEHERDSSRLNAQLDRVREVMKCGGWLSLSTIAAACDAPQASVSARLRDLRKERFGSWIVERQYKGNGLYLYRLAGRRHVTEVQVEMFT